VCDGFTFFFLGFEREKKEINVHKSHTSHAEFQILQSNLSFSDKICAAWVQIFTARVPILLFSLGLGAEFNMWHESFNMWHESGIINEALHFLVAF
jgi:hypothetical protein